MNKLKYIIVLVLYLCIISCGKPISGNISNKEIVNDTTITRYNAVFHTYTDETIPKKYIFILEDSTCNKSIRLEVSENTYSKYNIGDFITIEKYQ